MHFTGAKSSSLDSVVVKTTLNLHDFLHILGQLYLGHLNEMVIHFAATVVKVIDTADINE